MLCFAFVGFPTLLFQLRYSYVTPSAANSGQNSVTFVPLPGNGCMQVFNPMLGSREVVRNVERLIMPLQLCRLRHCYATLSNYLLLWACSLNENIIKAYSHTVNT
jgi:hypothetical protein